MISNDVSHIPPEVLAKAKALAAEHPDEQSVQILVKCGPRFRIHPDMTGNRGYIMMRRDERGEFQPVAVRYLTPEEYQHTHFGDLVCGERAE